MSRLLLTILMTRCLLGGIIAVFIQPFYHAQARLILQALINCHVHACTMRRSYFGTRILPGKVLRDKLLIEYAGSLTLIGIYVLAPSAGCPQGHRNRVMGCADFTDQATLLFMLIHSLLLRMMVVLAKVRELFSLIKYDSRPEVTSPFHCVYSCPQPYHLLLVHLDCALAIRVVSFSLQHQGLSHRLINIWGLIWDVSFAHGAQKMIAWGLILRTVLVKE